MKKRFEGRNLDDALGNAAKGFGAERYQLSYRVVLEKRGFLGGMKRVVIEAEVDESAQRPSDEVDDTHQPPSLASEDFGMQGHRFPQQPRRRGGRGHRGRPEHGPQSSPIHERPPAPREPIPEQAPQSVQAARIRDWCEELFDLARLDLQIRTEESEEQLKVNLYGRDAGLVTSHGGELLDSIQVIATKALVERGVEKPLEFDCGEFKERRAAELGRRAREVAEQVRRDGREQMLEAMSPIERRIVHLALQDDGAVATESRGEGFYKRIAIVPRKQEETMNDER